MKNSRIKFNYLFGVFGFSLIVNLLIILDINYFVISFLSFVFLMVIPGLLLLLIFKIKKAGFWEYLVYTIGLSVAFLMFVGLAVNWILPVLHITDKPLSLIPLLVSFDIILLIFGFIVYKRNKNISLKIKPPKLDRLNKVFFISPVVFSLLSVLGSITLNNGGPNYLTMIMLGGIGFYIFSLIYLEKKINKNIYPWAILLISISLLLANSLRSWHLIGWDISQEYEVFQLSLNSKRWTFSNFQSSYNACLSLTILPSILSTFLKINPEYIYKLIVQLIFSTLPIGIYLLVRRYSGVITALLASILFISQTWFIHEASTTVRQEFALLFFTLSLLVVFNNKINKTLRNLLFLIFGFSMVVSHYSTAYITLSIFIFTYMIGLVFRSSSKSKTLSNTLRKWGFINKKILKANHYHIGGSLVLTLTLFTVIWNGLITNNYHNFPNFANVSNFKLSNISISEILKHASNREIFGNLNLNSNKYITEIYQNVTNNYINQKLNLNLYEAFKYSNYIPETIPSKVVNSNFHPLINGFVIIMSILSKVIVTIVILLIGIFVLLKKGVNKVKIDDEYIILCLGSLIIIFAFFIFPPIEKHYGLTRIYAQSLILLAYPAVLGGNYMFKIFCRKYSYIFGIVVIFSFLYSSGFIFQLFGGQPYISLNNFGREYNKYYTFDTEVRAAEWMAHNYNSLFPVSTDVVARLRLWGYAGIDHVETDLFPPAIDKTAYVYLSNTNFVHNTAFAMYDVYHISYNAPTQFLGQNKNLIYNNGGSAIFK